MESRTLGTCPLLSETKPLRVGGQSGLLRLKRRLIDLEEELAQIRAEELLRRQRRAEKNVRVLANRRAALERRPSPRPPPAGWTQFWTQFWSPPGLENPPSMAALAPGTWNWFPPAVRRATPSVGPRESKTEEPGTDSLGPDGERPVPKRVRLTPCSVRSGWRPWAGDEERSLLLYPKSSEGPGTWFPFESSLRPIWRQEGLEGPEALEGPERPCSGRESGESGKERKKRKEEKKKEEKKEETVLEGPPRKESVLEAPPRSVSPPLGSGRSLSPPRRSEASKASVVGEREADLLAELVADYARPEDSRQLTLPEAGQVRSLNSDWELRGGSSRGLQNPREASVLRRRSYAEVVASGRVSEEVPRDLWGDPIRVKGGTKTRS